MTDKAENRNNKRKRNRGRDWEVREDEMVGESSEKEMLYKQEGFPTSLSKGHCVSMNKHEDKSTFCTTKQRHRKNGEYINNNNKVTNYVQTAARART